MVQAYCPLIQGRMDFPLFNEIAKKVSIPLHGSRAGRARSLQDIISTRRKPRKS